ncbi:MAG TPA: SEL1-like repeat protein [Polyangiaceae bacterium]|nr:SEL1-like repeat protein [Polyangiaceae bacterium]
MLALYYRDGLGVLPDRASAARTFERACNLGAERYCEHAASMYVEQAARLVHRARLAEMKVEADRHADRGTPAVESFYVVGAKLSEAKPLQPNGLDHEVHRQKGQEYDPNSLVPGTSLVLSIRRFFPGPGMITDAEAFDKLSMEIPSLRVGVPVDLGAADVRFYYAEGSSSWSATAGQAFAKQAQGTVTILSVDEARGVLMAHLDLVAQPHFADCTKPGADPDVKEVHGEFTFVRKNLAELSAWLGGKQAGLRNFP